MYGSDISFLVSQLAFAIPNLLVSLIGLIVAVVCIRRYLWPSILTGAAMLISIFFSLLSPVAQTWLLHSRVENGWTAFTYGRVLTVVNVFVTTGHILTLILLLIAVFIGRKQPTVIKA